MRGKQALKNIAANILLQIVTAVSGLLLPRFYLLAYGSAMNGMVSSITQFMAYLMLVEAGISAASIVGLYAPLTTKCYEEINSILAATNKFYLRSGILYTFLVALFAVFYPFIIKEQVSPITTRLIILILASSNLIDYLFLGKYRVLLMADQKGYVVTATQIFGTIINTIVCVDLIQKGVGITEVKFVATAVFIMRSIYIYYYVKKKYPYLNLKVQPKDTALSQHWSALIHQLAGVVLNNTNIVILTVGLKLDSLLEVSVYTIYQMVSNLVISVINSFTTALSAGFGEVISRKDEKTLIEAYSNYEFIFQILLFICYTCMGLLYISFVKIYTSDIVDVNYIRPSVAMLFTFIGLMQNIRVPALTVITAAGHYTQTQKRAVMEAVINIVIALLLIRPFGLEGVLIGTLCAFVFSSINIYIYVKKNLIKNIMQKFMCRFVRNSLFFIVYILLYYSLQLHEPHSYKEWFLRAMVIGITSMFFYTVGNAIFEPEQMRQFLKRVKLITLSK